MIGVAQSSIKISPKIMMSNELIINSDHFDDLALDIAGDLLNRGLLYDNGDTFNEAIQIIVHRLKHQQFVNNNPEDYIDSPSKGPMNAPLPVLNGE